MPRATASRPRGAAHGARRETRPPHQRQAAVGPLSAPTDSPYTAFAASRQQCSGQWDARRDNGTLIGTRMGQRRDALCAVAPSDSAARARQTQKGARPGCRGAARGGAGTGGAATAAARRRAARGFSRASGCWPCSARAAPAGPSAWRPGCGAPGCRSSRRARRIPPAGSDPARTRSCAAAGPCIAASRRAVRAATVSGTRGCRPAAQGSEHRAASASV